MEALRISEIAKACNGVPYNMSKDFYIKGISTDSRRINREDLFIPLKGERFDGHDYIEEVYKKGIQVVLTEKKPNIREMPFILVENTLKALQDIAKYYKEKFNIKIVAITGSSGKTTTKDMVAAVIGCKYKVLKTEGNLNNEIGLPLTIFNLNSSHNVAVLEMGMSFPDEIRTLAAIARPDIGIITNVGTAHIENLKSRENILKAKMELFTYFDENNTAIVNGDNDLLKTIKNVSYKLIKFGIEPDNDYVAENIRELGYNGVEFDMNINNEKHTFRVPMPGIHNVYNAMSAIITGNKLEMSVKEISEGLMNFKPSKLRMDIFDTSTGLKIINDTYNANPDSMCAAISTLVSLRNNNRLVCILGDMLELGEKSEELHRHVGEYVKKSNIDVLISVGKHAEYIAKGAVASGLDKENVYYYSSNEELLKSIDSVLANNDTILVKGSRGMKMEVIVEYLNERG